MSGKVSSLSRRLAKMEKATAKRAERDKLAGCICKYYPSPNGVTVAISTEPDKFEAEMNQTCSAHGFRRLGHIIVITPEDPFRRSKTRMDELLEEYEARLRAYESEAKLEH